jgi:hypothetical protein
VEQLQVVQSILGEVRVAEGCLGNSRTQAEAETDVETGWILVAPGRIFAQVRMQVAVLTTLHCCSKTLAVQVVGETWGQQTEALGVQLGAPSRCSCCLIPWLVELGAA